VAGSWNEVQASREGDDLVVQRRATPTDRVALLDWYADPFARIEEVTFDDGTSWDAATLESRVGVSVNEAPQLWSPIADQLMAEGEALVLELEGVFVDTDPGDSLTFAAALADGSPLPAWLSWFLPRSKARREARIPALSRSDSLPSTPRAPRLRKFELTVLDANLAPALLKLSRCSGAGELRARRRLAAGLFADRAAIFVVAAQSETQPSWLAFDAATLTCPARRATGT
jgi:hypothetical protein